MYLLENSGHYKTRERLRVNWKRNYYYSCNVHVMRGNDDDSTKSTAPKA